MIMGRGARNSFTSMGTSSSRALFELVLSSISVTQWTVGRCDWSLL
jgi:hypothetical protein